MTGFWSIFAFIEEGARRAPARTRTLPMGRVDRRAPLRFLETAFEPRDSVAMFRKSYDTSSVAQRVGSLSWVQSGRFQRWLRAMNSRQYNLFAGRIDRVVLMLDGDDAGRQGAMSIAQTLATRMSVVPIVLDNGRQPDQMTPRQIVDVLSTALVRAV